MYGSTPQATTPYAATTPEVPEVSPPYTPKATGYSASLADQYTPRTDYQVTSS